MTASKQFGLCLHCKVQEAQGLPLEPFCFTKGKSLLLHTHTQIQVLLASLSLQVMKELQGLAMRNELRFEVSKQTALAFLIKRTPEDFHSLAESISQRHGIVSRQQAHRLDVAYCSFAAAAADGGGAASAITAFPSGARDAACYDESQQSSSKDKVCGLQLVPASPKAHQQFSTRLIQTQPSLCWVWLYRFPRNSEGCRDPEHPPPTPLLSPSARLSRLGSPLHVPRTVREPPQTPTPPTAKSQSL